MAAEHSHGASLAAAPKRPEPEEDELHEEEGSPRTRSGRSIRAPRPAHELVSHHEDSRPQQASLGVH